MTIIFFTRLFYPHIGGVEKHVFEISKILIKKGYKIIVFTEQFGAKLKLKDSIHGIEIYRIPVGKEDWFKKFRIWWWLFTHRHLIKKCDIVHCHDVFFWYIPFKFLYPNKPVYTTFHGYETKLPPLKKAIFVRKLSEKLSWGNICVGDYIRKWYGTKPDYVAYGAVDLKSQKSEVRSQNDKSKFKILLVGRLESDTGVPNYLKTLDILKEKKINFEFEACGDGPLRSAVVRYGKVHGFVEDLNSYLKNAGIVFSSSYLSILEAMKYKKLVFAFCDNPLKEDYLKMAPFAKWIIIKNSPQETVRKIVYYLNHQEKMEEITKEAYRWVKDQTWERVAKSYIKVWRVE